MGLLMTILAMLTEIFTTVLKVQLQSANTSHLQQDGRYILSKLRYDISHAESISEPATVSAQTDTLELSVDGQDRTYRFANNTIELLSSNNTDQLTSYDVQVTDFTNTRLGTGGGKDTIRVTFTLVSGDEVKQFEMAGGLR